jgi:hypothetical protein
VAALLAKLAENDLLDSSLVVVGNDMGDSGLHISKNVPYVLAGGAGGALRTGRYIALKSDDERETKSVPNNRLLVSIAQMFGQQLDRFGETIDPDDAVGGLSELT